MGFAHTQRWCRASAHVSGPTPPWATLGEMLDEIAEFLRQSGTRPVRMETESWRRPEGVTPEGRDNDFLARIRIEVAPGELHTSFRRWYQWQHPQFEWSRRPLPAQALLAAAPAPAPFQPAPAGEGKGARDD